MRRKRITFENVDEVFNLHKFKIAKEDGVYFYEVGDETTTDLAEAVSILMRVVSYDDKIWSIELNSEMINESIIPEKALYWLSGGKKEWNSMDHYKYSWCDSHVDFQEEFGELVIDIVRGSKTLADIRNGFIKHINLNIIYDFALSRNMIR